MKTYLQLMFVALFLFVVNCGGQTATLPIQLPPSLQSEKDICLGKVIPIVSDLTTRLTLEECKWLDNRPHVLIEYFSCKRVFVNSDKEVTKVKTDLYERWTFLVGGTSFLLKNWLKILYFDEVNKPACVDKFFGVDGIDDPDYLPKEKYCEIVTVLKCDTGK